MYCSRRTLHAKRAVPLCAMPRLQSAWFGLVGLPRYCSVNTSISYSSFILYLTL